MASAADFNKKSLIWDSGKINSGESILQEYTGPALQSAKRYYWQVKVWDNQSHESLWSETAWWEMGLLKPEDWKASWVEPEQNVDPKSMPPAPLLRKGFALAKKIQSARLYVIRTTARPGSLKTMSPWASTPTATTKWPSFGRFFSSPLRRA